MTMIAFALGGSIGAFGASSRCGSAPDATNEGMNAAAARLLPTNLRRVME